MDRKFLAFAAILLAFSLAYSLLFESHLGISEWLFNLTLFIVEKVGVLGILVSQMLESALIPIPSEVVVPFAGFMSRNFLHVMLFSLGISVANLIGAVIAYFIGKTLGRDFIEKHGKYVLLKKKHLDHAEKFFEKHGEKAIFFSRIMPVVRTVASLPAGIGEMNFRKFIVYTFFGSLIWNFGLCCTGFLLGVNWLVVREILSKFDLFFLTLLVLAIAYFFRH